MNILFSEDILIDYFLKQFSFLPVEYEKMSFHLKKYIGPWYSYILFSKGEIFYYFSLIIKVILKHCKKNLYYTIRFWKVKSTSNLLSLPN